MNDSQLRSVPSPVRDLEKGSKAVMSLLKQDKLGRRAKSQRQARKAESSGKVNWRVFEPPAGQDEISVDRLGIVPDDKVAEIAQREFNDKFYGWYALTVWDVIRAGGTARCSDTDSNPYHADIVCPGGDPNERKHVVRDFALRLVSRAEFKRWGSWK